MELFLTADERVKVLVEGSNFTLQQVRLRKEGKHAGEEFWTDVGFYGNMEDALAGAIEKADAPWAKEHGFLSVQADREKVVALLKRLRGVLYHLSLVSVGFPQPSETASLEGAVVGNLRDNPWR